MLPLAGQLVLGSWRNDRVQGPVHEPVTFQSPKNLDQHLLRNAGNASLKLREAATPARKAVDNNGRPLIANKREQPPCRISLVEHLTPRRGHRRVTTTLHGPLSWAVSVTARGTKLPQSVVVAMNLHPIELDNAPREEVANEVRLARVVQPEEADTSRSGRLWVGRGCWSHWAFLYARRAKRSPSETPYRVI